MKCAECDSWVLLKKAVYEDGSEVVLEPEQGDDKAFCSVLRIRTDPSFGCTYFTPGTHVKIEYRTGAPWQRWHLIACPDCGGRGSNFETMRHCERCVGEGTVRKYDDGYIGENKTRKHTKELSDKQSTTEDDPAFKLNVQSSIGKRGIL